MTAARTTKVFGMNVALDGKLIVLILIVAAGLIYYFTSSSDSQSAGSASAVSSGGVAVRPATPGLSLNARAVAARRANASRSDRSTLKLVAVDGSRGDVDPTLRLRLLEQLKSVPEATASRNLFDAGNPAAAENMPAMPAHPPQVKPGPLPGSAGAEAATPPLPPFNIPLKYYGFVKPKGNALDGNRGFFMDGENILVGGEGDMLEKRFLIVSLTPNMARLEDTSVKQGQDLQVTPEAGPTQ
jgi:hypothetical protein